MGCYVSGNKDKMVKPNCDIKLAEPTGILHGMVSLIKYCHHTNYLYFLFSFREQHPMPFSGTSNTSQYLLDKKYIQHFDLSKHMKMCQEDIQTRGWKLSNFFSISPETNKAVYFMRTRNK